MYLLNVIWCVTVLTWSTGATAFEEELTISIDPGIEECFYQNVKTDEVIDVEYQVIDGGQGDIDITFRLVAPSGRLIVIDIKKPENSHRFEALEEGDYRFCWDNTFSRFNSKTVFFELIVERDDDEDKSDFDFGRYGIEDPLEFYDMKVQDVQSTVAKIHLHLSKIRHLQDNVRAFEARDRNIAESNFTRVNLWSIIQIVVMISVGLIQVIMVKSLFKTSC